MSVEEQRKRKNNNACRNYYDRAQRAKKYEGTRSALQRELAAQNRMCEVAVGQMNVGRHKYCAKILERLIVEPLA